MKEWFNKITAAISAAFTVALSVFCTFFPIGRIQITVSPAVFETGDDYYAVVWATSTKSTGYIKYTYNGEEKTIWDAPSGLIATDNTVHVIKVPKEELRNNTYKVGSQYVVFKYGYSALKGKTVESQPITFNGIEKEDGIKILTLSDIHDMTEPVENAVNSLNCQPDVVALVGDISSSMEEKSTYTESILGNAAKYSKGEIPVIYIRGNHETRGEFASQMIQYFPTKTGEFYYTFNFGSLSAIVLDSGEDKEDSNKEYDGLVDFSSYRQQELKWINSLSEEDFNGKYKLVFSHNPVVNNYFGNDWTINLKNLGADLIVGGHFHKTKFTDGELPVLIDGGKGKESLGYEYAATLITLNDGKINILTVDNNGRTILDEIIECK